MVYCEFVKVIFCFTTTHSGVVIRLYISVNSFRISPKIYDEATQTRPPKKSASQSTFYLPAIFVSGFRDSRVIFFGSTIKELDSHFPFWLSRKHSFFRHPHTHILTNTDTRALERTDNECFLNVCSRRGGKDDTGVKGKAKDAVQSFLLFFYSPISVAIYFLFFWEKTKDDKSAEWRSVGAGVWDQICF